MTSNHIRPSLLYPALKFSTEVLGHISSLIHPTVRQNFENSVREAVSDHYNDCIRELHQTKHYDNEIKEVDIYTFF